MPITVRAFTLALVMSMAAASPVNADLFERQDPDPPARDRALAVAVAVVIVSESAALAVLVTQRIRRSAAERSLRAEVRALAGQAPAPGTGDHVRDLAGRLIASQEAERQRIARDLHDDLGQRLSLLNVELGQLRIAARQMAGTTRARVDRAADIASEIAADIHRLSHDLHPARLKALGLVQGVAGLCRDIGSQHALAVVFEHANVPDAVDPHVSICLYRIVRRRG